MPCRKISLTPNLEGQLPSGHVLSVSLGYGTRSQNQSPVVLLEPWHWLIWGGVKNKRFILSFLLHMPCLECLSREGSGY